MTVIHLVRHGQTDWNLTGRIQGTADIPLNETGRAQARDAADALRDVAGDGETVVVCSDLSRARETAVIIAGMLGLAEPEAVPALRERSYGVGEGMTAAELTARFGSSRADDIPGAEARPLLRRRAVGALLQIADARPDSVVIAVTHGALIAEVVRSVTDERQPAPGTPVPNGGGYSLVVDDEGMRLLDAARARV